MGSPNQTNHRTKKRNYTTSPSPGPTDGTNVMQTNSQKTDSHQSMGSPNQPISSDKDLELSSPASLSPEPIDTLSSPYSDSQPNVSFGLKPDPVLSNAGSQVALMPAPMPTIDSASIHTMVIRAQAGIRKPNTKYVMAATMVHKSIEPRNVNKALAQPLWVAAMQEELEALYRNAT